MMIKYVEEEKKKKQQHTLDLVEFYILDYN